jgi:hypothetical protein
MLIKGKQSIKISSTAKGLTHYEDYLIKKHHRELQQFLFERNFPDPAKRKIYFIYSKRVNRENIISLYTHPPLVFLNHLIDNTLELLQTNTSITNLK